MTRDQIEGMLDALEAAIRRRDAVDKGDPAAYEYLKKCMELVSFLRGELISAAGGAAREVTLEGGDPCSR